MAFYRFSVYLLKETVEPEENSGYLSNIIKSNWSCKNQTDWSYKNQTENSEIGNGALLYINENPKSDTNSWETYLHITNVNKDLLRTVSPSALVCVPYQSRWFVLCFGHGSFHINKDLCVEDFGSKAALNLLKKEKIKSLDAFSLVSSKKERIQSSREEDFVFFTADTDESLIKNVCGSIKDVYPDVSNIVGDCGVNVSTEIGITNIDKLLEYLLSSYQKDNDYLSKFPEFKNVLQETDKDTIDNLKASLIVELNSQTANDKVVFAQPIIEDIQGNYSYIYDCNGIKSPELDNISTTTFIDFAANNTIVIDEKLLDQKIIKVLDNSQTSKIKEYKLMDVINYTASLYGKNYYLFDGKWNLIDDDYIRRLNDFIKNYLFTTQSYLKDYYYTVINKNEDKFNKFCAANNKDVYLLDKKLIKTEVSTIEAADLLYFPDNDDKVYFIHNKLHRHSSTLSHLFNQGFVSAKLLNNDSNKRKELKDKIKALGKQIDQKKLDRIDNPANYKFIYGIIDSSIDSSETNQAKLLEHLPLLARIGLHKTIKDLFQLGASKDDVKVCFIHMDSIESVDFMKNVPTGKVKYPKDIVISKNEIININPKQKINFQTYLNNRVYKAFAFDSSDMNIAVNQYAIVRNSDNKELLIIEIENLTDIDIDTIQAKQVLAPSLIGDKRQDKILELWKKQIKSHLNLTNNKIIKLADIKIVYPDF